MESGSRDFPPWCKTYQIKCPWDEEKLKEFAPVVGKTVFFSFAFPSPVVRWVVVGKKYTKSGDVILVIQQPRGSLLPGWVGLPPSWRNTRQENAEKKGWCKWYRRHKGEEGQCAHIRCSEKENKEESFHPKHKVAPSWQLSNASFVQQGDKDLGIGWAMRDCMSVLYLYLYFY